MNEVLLKKIRDLPMVVSLTDTSGNRTGAWSLQKPDFSTKYPPCAEGCPAHVPVREILAEVLNQEFGSAAELLVEANPFPSITGRVCHHPCQQRCLRGDFDDSLEIRAIERFLADFINMSFRIPELISSEQKRIAVVGSGPSGLACAYFLRLKGYDITVFESRSHIGGMLYAGIPPYRLPEDVLNKEIERLKNLGIKFKTNVKVTKKYILDELKDFDAVFLGIGAHKSMGLDLTVKKNELVLSGLDFLSGYESYKRKFNNKMVAVIGGGNTAMDAARTALRFGADVKVIYRRTRDEMPAIPEEVEGALEEGCDLKFLTAPVRSEYNKGLIDLYCVKMELGEPDESGRRRPVPKTGSEFKLFFDYVITAIGEIPDSEHFEGIVALNKSDISINRSGQTSEPYIFAGGDAAGFERTVIDAIESGKNAAKSMISYFKGKKLPEPKVKNSAIEFEDINTNYFDQKDAVSIGSIPPAERKTGFGEIIEGLNESDVICEAERCFSCGVCTYCDNCIIFCPDYAVVPAENEYLIKDEYCKGCGICIEECPRNVLFWRQKA
ncbi:NAD(P)-binding protein [candidate division KSB1 bacterium]